MSYWLAGRGLRRRGPGDGGRNGRTGLDIVEGLAGGDGGRMQRLPASTKQKPAWITDWPSHRMTRERNEVCRRTRDRWGGARWVF